MDAEPLSDSRGGGGGPPAPRGAPKMPASSAVTWAFFLGLLVGAIQPGESNSSRVAVCQGYPDFRREPQGQIYSPPSQEVSYGNCSWIILGGPEDIIYIRFQRFSLSCGSEVLTIHPPAQPPKRICGYKTPEPLRIKGGNVTLSYSGKFMMGYGFLLKYERESKSQPAPPCNLTLDNFYGVLSPPPFTSDLHLGAVRCQWALDAHDSRPLTIRFTILDLDVGDSLHVYEGVPGAVSPPHLLRNLDYTSNNKVVSVDSPSSRAWVTYQAVRGTVGRGFNATYHVRGFCVPWDFPCGGGDGEGATCYSSLERCDGIWDCANGADEEGCQGCPPGQYACGGRRISAAAICYGAADRCNYQTFCADAADERHCYTCQPGNFRCRDGRCIYESWVCDGQADCVDASDEADCSYVLPRKVVTAAVIGSLVCGLLLVVALACTCRLYALRSHEFGILAPMSRMEAQLVQRQAPPSYGQLIARGVIPPVEGFPTEHPNQNSMLGSLRSLLHLLRRDPATTTATNGGRRPYRSRFVRRMARRMRRLGLLPRPAPSSSSSSSSATTANNNNAATANSSPLSAPDTLPEPFSGDENTTSGQREEQAPPLPQKVPPPLPPAEPVLEPRPPAPPTPRLSGMMHNLRVRLFPPTPPCSAEAADPLSAPPSPVDEDDVLLVPLTEPRLEDVNTAANWEADDEPLLT